MSSPREDVAQELLETVVFGGLDEVYGASKEKRTDAKGKSYWDVSFCKARTVDGTVKVYSEKFILVKWQTQFRDMPHQGQEVFKNVNAAKSFLVKSFVR
ncbi:MAG TPA: hypothetical protein PK317_00285 [Coprothermobacter proteolyticus]|nr:hypothetical protein [Coprothermobacter proteolyticus]